MSIFCFEGYNNQIVKYIKRYKDKNLEIESYLEKASEIIGIDLSDYLYNVEKYSNVDDIIAKIVITYSTGIHIFNEYLEKGLRPKMVMGYSLGSITAAVCSRAISFETGLEVLKCIGECIRYADKEMDCSLLIEMGLNEESIKQIFKLHGVADKAQIVCRCSEFCILICGDNEAIDKCIDDIREAGALGVNKLEVRMPFHLEENMAWIDKFCLPINEIEVSAPKIPYYSVTKMQELKTEEEIRDGLHFDFIRELHWKDSIDQLQKMGYRDFFDISLNGSIKKMTILNQEESNMFDYKHFRY